MARSLIALFIAALVAREGTSFADEAAPTLLAPPVAGPASPPPAPIGVFIDAQYRSPGLAVALSLQPLPIDFGNFYAENLGWGVFYTAVEVALLAPMMWMTGSHMGHGVSDERGWSGMEMGAMTGMVSGYVVIKAISGVHAAYAARELDRRHGTSTLGFVVPTAGGALLGWGGRL
jgi:hypothetical protein